MKFYKSFKKLPFLLMVILIGCNSENNSRESNLLWYQQPATKWMEALPLGNGRLGVMVYGGVEEERIALNEVTMWSGQPDENQERACGKEKLNEIRKLFFKGDYVEGNRMATEFLTGRMNSFGSHVPLGDLIVKFHNQLDKPQEYYRELDLETAIHTVKYKAGATQITRKSFCSNPDGVFVMNITSSIKNALNMDVSLDLLRPADIREERNNCLAFAGKVNFPRQGPGGVNFYGAVVAQVKAGSVSFENKELKIKGASEVTIMFDVRTDYNNNNYREHCLQTLENALGKDYYTLETAHTADYSPLYSRVSFSVNSGDKLHIPTDVRWKQIKEGKNDLILDEIFFNYARYLLIAASREDSPLPAALQGIWNDNLACNSGWTNDYHLDINTQQNYWMSNPANLAECNTPLFKYINQLAYYGSRTAQKVYGAKGWTAHTMANVWGYTAPGSGANWGLHPTGGAWISTHLWRHYCYTQDLNFLRNEAYPLLKSAAQFLLDYMVEDPRFGYLVTGPSTSPENSFLHNDTELSLSMMPTCDMEITREVWNACLESSRILNIDTAFADSLIRQIAKLSPFRISSTGGLCEWLEDFEQAMPNHRHTSHLLAVYPFAQITLDNNPKLLEAAKKTLEHRLNAEGWEDVEWSRANSVCFNARYGDGEKAYKHLVALQRNLTGENLMTISPKGIAGAPYDIFAFDGNEAGGAGMCEMLLQSYGGVIRLLPALPAAWTEGSFKGLCGEGGYVIDASWKGSELTHAVVRSTKEQLCMLANIAPETYEFTVNGKQITPVIDSAGYICFDLKYGDVLNLKKS